MKMDFIESRKNVYLQIFECVKEYRKNFVILFFIQLLFLVGLVVNPYLYGILIDRIMIGRKIDLLKWVCLGYIAIYIFNSILIICQRRLQVFTFNDLKLKLRKIIWDKYMYVPYTFFEENGSGDLRQRMDTDIDAFENFINEQVITYTYNCLMVIIFFAINIVISWKLTIFSLLMVPVAFWLTKRMAKGSGEAWKNYRTDYGEYENWLHGSLLNWKEIKILNSKDKQIDKFSKFWEKLKINYYKGCLYFFLNQNFISFTNFFITKMNLYFFGGILIFHGDLKIGLLFVFMKYYEKFFEGITNITQANMTIVEYLPKINRVLEILNIKKEEKADTKCILEKYNIEFRNVSFRYANSERYVLNHLNLKIESKECLAIVGDSGNGKTTLIKLLLGLYNEYDGEILIDDINIKSISKECINRNIAVVMQDCTLYNDTILNNMRLVKKDATSEMIKEACKKAFIHNDIKNMPLQYETIIGEKGIQLSGGQKQRLAIARALLVNPNILIFDEATSALDSESETAINEVIRKLKGQCTIIIIAHRLSSVMVSNQIAVLKNTKIIEQGTFEELIHTESEFKKLFTGQIK